MRHIVGKHVALIEVALPFLEEALHIAYGFPPEARILHVEYDAFREVLTLAIEHPDLPLLGEGEALVRVDIHVTLAEEPVGRTVRHWHWGNP